MTSETAEKKVSESAAALTTIAVVGAGTMGRGIALCALAAGLSVHLVDLDGTQLERAASWLRARRETPDGGRTLTATPSLAQGCAGAEVVIEAVVEDLGAKRSVLAAAEAAAPPGAVLATNTSGLPITRIAEGVADPSRVVGMHFFNPVWRMQLCEIVAGDRTAPEVADTAVAAAERLGRTPVRVADTPGFVASRLNCALGNEALTLLESGAAGAEDIDTAARLGLNHPMGPLELLDLVGLDVRLAALETLEAAFGERFRPRDLHRRLVEEGRLGRKAGRGIYVYDDEGRRAGEAQL